METRLIIINGAPGTGKTILGRRLSQELTLPLLSKDDIKESLFDSLGWKDREWSEKLGGVSFDLLFYLLDRQLQAQVSLIVETAFMPSFNTARFVDLKIRYGFVPFQIFCYTETQTLHARFQNRITSGERHPGHGDQIGTFAAFKQVIDSDKYGILDIGGHLINVDTTDFGAVDHARILQAIQNAQASL